MFVAFGGILLYTYDILEDFGACSERKGKVDCYGFIGKMERGRV